MSRQRGFTIVELMVTLFVGALLILSGCQLYITVVDRTAEARRMSEASNIGYGVLRKEGTYKKLDADCSHPEVTNITRTASLQNLGIKMYRCRPNMKVNSIKVTVVVKYDVPEREVIHATYVSP